MNILIVGTGLAGTTFARLAAENGHSIHIIDQKDHIGGNCYSAPDSETGIEIHKYGPHIFHTNSDKAYRFINRFTKLNTYRHRVKVKSNGRLYDFPINLNTINKFFSTDFTSQEARNMLDDIYKEYKEPKNFKEAVINSVGRKFYKYFFKEYTIKQWGDDPENLAMSILRNDILRFNTMNEYFSDKYQGIPEKGYGKMFKRMLDHKNIEISLKFAFDDIRGQWRRKYDFLVFTGSLDQYYNYEYGFLPYRAVNFDEIRARDIQRTAVVNYCDMSVPYIRSTEFKYFTPEKDFSDSVAWYEKTEISTSMKACDYPVECEYSRELYQKYLELIKQETNAIFTGRAASYQNLNMDQVVLMSMAAFEEFCQQISLATIEHRLMPILIAQQTIQRK